MLMTKAAYARHCSVSRQTVYDWVAKGEVVMSGSKIDVEATERRSAGDESPSSNNRLTMSAKELINWVHTHDGKYPPAQSQDEARQLVATAVKLIAYDIEFISDDEDEEETAVRISFDDCEHIFRGFHLLDEAMYFIRDYFYAECLTADLRGIGSSEELDPDGVIITMERLKALCTPLETDEARHKRFYGEGD
ncbi:helix-turn-helix transcriptional regulator [Enterobacter ludwigii]